MERDLTSGSPSCACPTNCWDYVYSGGGSRRDSSLSDYLFYRDPFITAYNIISSIFRGMGDSKSPMYFIAVACAANIGLEYLFIGLLGLDAAGAALGTTSAQELYRWL